METALYWIAGITTGLFVLRLVLMFMGLDGLGDAADAADAADGAHALDAAADAADVADFKIFTLLTAVVTLMVGSWTALLMIETGSEDWVALLVGFVVGFGSSVAVSWAIYGMRKLEHDGTLRDFEAAGMKGTVYVKIPEAGKGKGQVQISVDGRARTFDAVSDGPEIDSFQPVVVMARLDQQTLRVCPTE